MPKFPQPSLSGGEIAPSLRGRTDISRYPISLGLAKNFITKPTGGGAKRPGTIFRGRVKFSNRITRLIPFIYSTTVKYMIEMGNGYLRFWVDGALLTNASKSITGISNAATAVVTAPAHGYANGDQVVITGVRGMSRINAMSFTIAGATTNTFQLVGFNSVGLAAYAGGGQAGRIVEVTTPYDSAKVADVRMTQSADVLYMVHGAVPPKQLRRTGVNVFELVDFAFRRGPFRPPNSNDALVMAATGTEGQISISVNSDVFTVNMVGSLVMMEEQDLRDVKPWASAERSPPVGARRRSDSKVYRITGIPSNIGTEGAPYYVTGSQRPIHGEGRAYDGPQDVKSDGVNSYAVGVEWEFLYNTFGIAKITGYVDERNVLATVIERLPDSVAGTIPSPGNTWALAGDGVAKVFPIAGATSQSQGSYTVTISGVPTPPNPNTGGFPDDEWCVDANSQMPDGRMAREYVVGDMLACYDNNPETPSVVMLEVTANAIAVEKCLRLVTSSGASVVASVSTPMTLRDGTMVMLTEMAGRQALVYRAGGFAWEWVTSLLPAGSREVCKISVSDQCYFAGETGEAFIATHNIQNNKP